MTVCSVQDGKVDGGAFHLKAELARLLNESGLTPDNDKMPLDQGIGKELPDQKIR